MFVTEDQIQEEIDGMVEFARYLYDLFGVTASAELSTRPEKRTRHGRAVGPRRGGARGSAEAAPDGLRRQPGEGTFYGPKIDLHMTDSLGRSWQMGTIQLDYQMPTRFGLTYFGADNAEHHPVVIHRALLGRSSASRAS